MCNVHVSRCIQTSTVFIIQNIYTNCVLRQKAAFFDALSANDTCHTTQDGTKIRVLRGGGTPVISKYCSIKKTHNIENAKRSQCKSPVFIIQSTWWMVHKENVIIALYAHTKYNPVSIFNSPFLKVNKGK